MKRKFLFAGLGCAAALGVALVAPASAAPIAAPVSSNTVQVPLTRVVDVPGISLTAANPTSVVQIAGKTFGAVSVPGNATGVTGRLVAYQTVQGESLVVWDGVAGAPGDATVTSGPTTTAHAGPSSAYTSGLKNGTVSVHLNTGSGSFLLEMTSYTIPATPGPQGPAGPAGPVGPQGPPGTPAAGPVTATATTVLSNWPETSGWANDTFSRNMTITLQHTVPADKCGPDAQRCFFYLGALNDSGSILTVDGASSPADAAVKISGANSGTINGGAHVEFYADSDTPSAVSVPTSVTGADKGGNITTSNWYKQFFAKDTLFVTTTVTNAPFSTYDWLYTVPGTCEQWNDGVNPGDDGQNAAKDGNITGTSACVTPSKN